MIDYMLMNLGLVAAAIGLKPEHVDPSALPQSPSATEPKILTGESNLQNRDFEGMPVVESLYSPIRRSDFL